MWFPIIIALAVGLTAVAPGFSKGLAWVITMTITVPLVMLGGGCMAYTVALLTGMTSGSMESFIMCCAIFGGIPSIFICWVIFG